MNYYSEKNVSSLKAADYFKRMFFLLLLLLTVCNLNAQKKQDVITFDIGSFTITLLSEMQNEGKKDILIGATDEMLQTAIPNGTFPMAINAFLVEAGGKTILFDAGLGMKLFDNLKTYKKTPADVDVIVLTHMHGDHIGGLLQNDEKSFPNAELYIPQTEYDYWMNDSNQKSAEGAHKVIAAYKDKLQLFVPGSIDDVQELFPGIRSVAAYGHTPGHTAYLLESDGSKIFIWGDLMHAMAIQMPFPQVAVTYDIDPVKAIESRQHLFNYLSVNKIKVAGMHLPFPAVGQIRKNKSDGYEFDLICDCEGR